MEGKGDLLLKNEQKTSTDGWKYGRVLITLTYVLFSMVSDFLKRICSFCDNSEDIPPSPSDLWATAGEEVSWKKQVNNQSLNWLSADIVYRKCLWFGPTAHTISDFVLLELVIFSSPIHSMIWASVPVNIVGEVPRLASTIKDCNGVTTETVKSHCLRLSERKI